MNFTFDINGDYKTEFNRAVTSIVLNDYADAAYKNALVQAVTDTYVNTTGEQPDIRELDDLSSWLIFGKKGVSVKKKIEIKAYEAELKRNEEAV